MAADLPPDILAEILSRLPVKSLLRFRSTSKSFKSLIDSQKFINLHLQNSLNFNLILRRKTDLYHLHFPNLTAAVPLNHPFKRKSNHIALLGSCNGLLAISNGEFAFINPNDANEITIWNPNTRKHRIIPFLPLPISILDPTIKCSLCVYGFGFDSLSDDYKLLRISYLIDHQTTFYDPHVRLFSSKTNSWKIIPSTMPYNLQYYHTMGVFVDNSSSIHWVATRKIQPFQHDLILAFNLTLETFNEVPLPDEVGEKVNCKKFEIRVAVLGGCLCMTVGYETTKVDIWVMKEYGSKDSWCKLFTLVKSSLDLPLESLRPLCYSRDGSKVLLEGFHALLEVQHWKLFWYDLKSEQVSHVEGISNSDDAMVCVGSLVPPPLPVDNCRKKENRTSKKRDDFLCKGFKLRL